MSKKIPTKYGKYELWTRSRLNQTCINKIHAMNNHNILINGKDKNKHKNEIEYLLHECTLQ